MGGSDLEGAGRFRIELLGGFRVSVGPRQLDDEAWRLRKSAALVKLLALAPGHRLHKEQAIDLLWPDLEPEAAAGNLRKALHVARRVLDPDPHAPNRYLRFHEDVLSLRRDDLWIDVEAFEAAADRARRAGDPEVYETAVELYCGDLLPNDRYEDWVIHRQEQLRGEYLALLKEWAALLEARAQLEAAVAALQRVIAIDPLDEQAHVGLMRLFALAGRRGEALQQFERLRETLRRELDADPDVATQEVYEEIRTGHAFKPELTVDLWDRVGDLRMLSGDAAGAAAAFESGLAALDGEPSSAGPLHRKAARARLMGHDADAAEQHVDAAELILRRSGDDAEIGRLQGTRANLLWERGRIEEAQEAADASLSAAERSGDPADVVAAYETLAIVCHFRGAWREGLHVEIERVGASADEDPQLSRVFDLHHCIGQYHLYGDGLFEGVEEYARHTLELAERAGARRAEAFGWCLLGESLLLRGHFDEAAACLERSAGIHVELGAPSVALPWQRLGELSVCLGDFEAADALLRRAISIATVSMMGRHAWGRIYATVALSALERDEPAAAVRAVRSAASAAARHGDCPTCSALLHPVAAEAYSAFGDAERAVAHAEAAEQVAGYFESSAWRAMSESALGSAALANGEPAGARERFASAAELYDRAEQPFWAARARLQSALADAGGDTRSLLEGAAGTFARLGAIRAESRAREALTRLTGPRSPA